MLQLPHEPGGLVTSLKHPLELEIIDKEFLGVLL